MLEQLRQVSMILATFRQNVQELLHENGENDIWLSKMNMIK